MTLRSLFLSCLLVYSIIVAPLSASLRGKIDAGIVVAGLDVIQSGSTIKEDSLWGGSTNATIVLCSGFCVKPRALVLTSSDSDLWNIGLGIGFIFPIGECITIAPVTGVTYGELETVVNLPVPGMVIPGVKEKFESTSPYLGVEASWTINECWMVSCTYHYAWARSKTTLTHALLAGQPPTTTESTGSNYVFQVDYFFTCHWSVNGTIANNDSRSKEKHGLKVTGGRLGIGYCF